ncbi:GNAT family N-acetyltransferase [Paenibacillus sp. strain BS8-2]
MEIRRFHKSDVHPIVSLFYDTVHHVNDRDYTKEQLDAWASREEQANKLDTWIDSLTSNTAYVAVLEDVIAGFADMTDEGYLDRLYIHKDYQRRGIATALVDVLEETAVSAGIQEIVTHASITAKPFFEHQGYVVVEVQSVIRKGIALTNFRMVKSIAPRNVMG